MSLVSTKKNGNGFPKLVKDFFDSDSFIRPYLPSFNWSLGDLEGLSTRMPSVNITENDKDFKIELAAPGLSKDDFKIEVDGRMLTISAEKEKEEKEEKENYRRREFSYNSFSRSFDLPENSIADKIDAKYENGILRLSLPKKEVTVSKPKKEIKVS